MSVEDVIKRFVTGRNFKRGEFPILFKDVSLSFNILYFSFNSINCKLVYFTRTITPLTEIALFSISYASQRIMIKIEASNADKIIFEVYGDELQLLEEFYREKLESIRAISSSVTAENKAIISKYIDVLKLIDTALYNLVNKNIVREIYFNIANAREILYKIFEAEKFDPLLISMASSLETLRKYSDEQPLIGVDLKNYGLKFLRWKSELLEKIARLIGR
ncbi:MAG: hypothetical protein OdinLCB4_001380 [Candidatus Odinarchaeum yellowstonii]|uniref:Uncharacterized protein n=1 Tax=Odinarchaeota yellowstonii (strain LCB_4) TaxID=1841599 RepID=A0AAF0D2Q0_ODILC|nr:MAG: hypothetical protein OdinLCB4_001380 [Candidatus Odinarchaeum yellowstonii]